MSKLFKNVLLILLYGALFFLLERYLTEKTGINGVQYTFSHPLLAFVSVIEGPLIGGFGFAVGELFLQIGSRNIDWIRIICSFLNCAMIGWLTDTTNIKRGIFERGDALRFNRTQLLSNLVCWMLLYPLLVHLIEKETLFPLMQREFWVMLGYVISDLISATIFLSLYARSRISLENFYRN